jgi:hypothetical protein
VKGLSWGVGECANFVIRLKHATLCRDQDQSAGDFYHDLDPAFSQKLTYHLFSCFFFTKN